jgi:hypothetical protein
MGMPRLARCALALGGLLAFASPAGAVLASNSLSVNALTSNALTSNALTSNAVTNNAIAPSSSAIGDLNGVVVDAVTLPDNQ